ncbi:ATP-binding protein [Hwanghaeella grinnelliae]|uniref:ATP-binding protein n=2 Tax=Hwanghaeella grinnelliae TaxID=2500179 RepID=A0A437QZ74_9PROT|nr:ATP-binding protein [Hwanghaeella grinnelliae]
MGAGKSHKAKELAGRHNAVLISEDVWLASHFPGKISSFQDYLDFSRRIGPFVRNHVRDILKTGTNVILDFPANTVSQRAWHRETATEIGSPHRLVYLEADDDLCLRQIAMRRQEQPERAAFDTANVFHQVTKFFEEPRAEEGLEIEVVHPQPERERKAP